MDMWDQYREAVQMALPWATIVVDRFHVSRMAGEALERIRKLLGATLPQKSKLTLMGDRWLLLRNENALSIQQTILLQSTLGQFPILKKAWEAKEGFRSIWKCQGRAEAEQAYREWPSSLDPEIAPVFSDLTKAMRNWSIGIFNYFEHRITNAYTESFNSIARKMDRMGRGYSFEVLRAKLLLKYSCHKLAPPPRRFVRSPLVMSRSMGAKPEERGAYLGVDISTLAAWRNSPPETG
jgi:transposase